MRLTAAVAAASAVAMIATACTSEPPQGDDAGRTAAADPQASSSSSAPPPVKLREVGGPYLLGRWPLTGRPARGKAPRRPVIVVKIDNTSSSAPQVGLGAADMVVQEIVEGGQTRLAAFYYQRIPQVAGPVRSLRATDVPLVKPIDRGVVVASGGAPPTVRRFSRAGVKIRTESARGFFRQSGRTAPYNLMVRVPEVQRTTQRRRAVPRAYLPWGNGSIDGPRARRITATFSAARSSIWTYAKGRYEPVTSYQPSRGRFRPRTVLVLRVPLGDAGYRDPAGNAVPETPLVGRGQAVVFHGGRLRKATWVKPNPGSALKLEDRRGRAVTVPAGRTWIELVPSSGSLSWSRR